MTLEQLIDEKAAPRNRFSGGDMVIKATDVIAWAIDQMQQGNLLPGATTTPTAPSTDTCTECVHGDDPCGLSDAFVNEDYSESDENGKFCIRCGHAPACHRKEVSQ